VPTLLIACASPLDQDRLRLGNEEKQIRQALQRSRKRDHWKIESNLAVTVDDLRRALLDHRPAVLHFAGHGRPDGLCFESEDGGSHAPDRMSVAKLFHVFRDDLKCVVLNACYSQPQAELIRDGIDYVIGMSASIEDDSAAKFAEAFYEAVFAGVDFRTAFDLGCSALDLNKLPSGEVPKFLTRVNHTTLAYAAHVPEAERIIHAYLSTPPLERAQLTSTGSSLQPTLAQFYGEMIHVPFDRVRVLSMQQLSEYQWRALTEVRLSDKSDTKIFYLQIRNRSVLVEWEATVGFWSMPAKTYLSLGSQTPVIARVKAELCSDYWGAYSDMGRLYQSIQLQSAGIDLFRGYVRRGSPEHKELVDLLSDGRQHDVTLEIANESGDPKESVIRRALSKTWLYTPPNPQQTTPTEGTRPWIPPRPSLKK
jgi:CHAT domain